MLISILNVHYGNNPKIHTDDHQLKGMSDLRPISSPQTKNLRVVLGLDLIHRPYGTALVAAESSKLSGIALCLDSLDWFRNLKS